MNQEVLEPFALHIAAAEDRLDLSACSDLNALVEGFAPVHFAAAYCPNSLKILLEAGADPTLQVQGGIYNSWEPVHFAALHGQKGALELLNGRLSAPIQQGYRKGLTALDLYLS